MSDNDDIDDKPSNKKVYVPFGTSDSNAFSKYAHLAGSPETLSFAMILSPENTEVCHYDYFIIVIIDIILIISYYIILYHIISLSL